MKQINKTFVLAMVFGGLLGTATAMADARDMQKELLIKLDASLNHMVDVCKQSLSSTNWRESAQCTDKLESYWWSDCAVYYDKLDTCKKGKMEEYLNSQGVVTKQP